MALIKYFCVWIHVVTGSPHGFGVIQQESKFCKLKSERMISRELMDELHE